MRTNDRKALSRLRVAALALGLLSLSARARAQGCTDDDDCLASGQVCIEGQCVRQGLRNPLQTSLQADAVRRDDEVVFLTADADPLLGYAYGDDDAAEERSLLAPVQAAAAGRVLGLAAEQPVIVRRVPGNAAARELVVLDPLNPDAEGVLRFGSPAAARYRFATVGEFARVALAIEDLDLARTPFPEEERHDEVVLAVPEATAEGTRAVLRVLSFEDVEVPASGEPPEPSQESAIALATPLVDPGADPLSIAIADLDGDGQRDIAVGVLRRGATLAEDRVVIEAFELELAPDGTRTLVPLQYFPGAPVGPLDTGTTGRSFGLIGGSFDGGYEFVEQVVVAGLHRPGSSRELRVAAWSLDTQGSWSTSPGGAVSTQFSLSSLIDEIDTGVQVEMLLDSRVVISKARFPRPSSSDYADEAPAVLVDSDRGPICHVFSFNSLIQSANGLLYSDLSTPTPVWPDLFFILAHPETDAPSDAQAVAGNFVLERNRVLTGSEEDRRPAGLVVSFPSSPVDPRPLLLRLFDSDGPVDDGIQFIERPDGSQVLHSLSTLLLADVDGDSAYFSAQIEGGQRLYLGEPMHFETEVRTLDTVLHEPPKHVDYLPELGGIVNVSQDDEFYVEFSSSTGEEQALEKTTQQDHTVSESGKLTLTEKVELGTASVGGSVTASQALGLEMVTSTSTGFFEGEQSSVTITQLSRTERDDQLVFEDQLADVWRYPVMGLTVTDEAGQPAPPEEQPDSLFYEIVLPSKGFNTFGPGRLVDEYEPRHINGNALSYPTFDLEGFEPADIGPFEVLENGAEVPQPPGTPIWAENAFIVGGSTVQVALEFTQSNASTQSFLSNDSFKESLELGVGTEVKASKGVLSGSVAAQFDYSVSDSHSFAQGETSANSTSAATRVGLAVPSSIPAERGYQFFPAWYFTPGGGMKVTHAVDMLGAGSAAAFFWETTYDRPDPALSLPHLIVPTPVGPTFLWTLNTDPTRNRMKGLGVKDSDGNLFFQVPEEGEEVVLEALVYNLSMVSPVHDLQVRFHVQEFAPGSLVGPRIRIADQIVPCIPPHGQAEHCPGDLAEEPPDNARVVRAVWDTKGFGPIGADGLRRWLVFVTLDPLDQLPGETHELLDRFGDPLLGPDGQPLDRLEKGQNNQGWSLISIAPVPVEEESLAIEQGPADVSLGSEALALARPGGAWQGGAAAMELGEAARVRVRYGADRTDRRVRGLRVLERGATGRERVVLSRRIWGVDASGGEELFQWIPPAAGEYELRAELEESPRDPFRGNATSLLRVRVLDR